MNWNILPFKQFDELPLSREEALTPLLQFAAAFNYIFWLAQKPPAALERCRTIDGESIEKRRPEVDRHPPKQRSVDAHGNIVDEALVGNYNVALAKIRKVKDKRGALDLENKHEHLPLFRWLVPWGLVGVGQLVTRHLLNETQALQVKTWPRLLPSLCLGCCYPPGFV